MSFQDRGPPKEMAAGEATDGQELSATETERKVPEQCIKNPEKSSFSIARHEQAATVLKGAWASGRTDPWSDTTRVLRVRLTVPELACTAFAFLRALPPDEREAVTEAAFFDADRPPPLFLDDQEIMREANLMVAARTTRELKAVVTAIWRVLGDGERSGFLARVVGLQGMFRYIRQAPPRTLDALFLATSRVMTPTRWEELVDYIKNGVRNEG